VLRQIGSNETNDGDEKKQQQQNFDGIVKKKMERFPQMSFWVYIQNGIREPIYQP